MYDQPLGGSMNLRIVVADEREANFFDALSPTVLEGRGTLQNPKAGLKDIDMETDRAGRRYGGSSGVRHGSGQVQGHHHGVDGERSTEQHELMVFAKDVAKRIDAERLGKQFDRLIIIAPPKMLGLLRQSLPGETKSLLAAEIAKDLVHHDSNAVLTAVPREAFYRM
jgi:protein required for attachment to host cells